jgi:hypothetical protein
VTQLRRDPSAISNYFDDVLRGVGHRGSSFTDLDACTHDEATGRFLFQEFKNEGEALNKGQKRLLLGLARLDYLTVWCVRRLPGDRVQWYDVAKSTEVETISIAEYRERFRLWWENAPYEPVPVTYAELTADDISW